MYLNVWTVGGLFFILQRVFLTFSLGVGKINPVRIKFIKFITWVFDNSFQKSHMTYFLWKSSNLLFTATYFFPVISSDLLFVEIRQPIFCGNQATYFLWKSSDLLFMEIKQPTFCGNQATYFFPAFVSDVLSCGACCGSGLTQQVVGVEVEASNLGIRIMRLQYSNRNLNMSYTVSVFSLYTK